MLVTQWSLTVCDPMDCSPPASSVHGILQARILEYFLQGIFLTQGLNLGLRIADRFFTVWTTKEAQCHLIFIIGCVKKKQAYKVLKNLTSSCELVWANSSNNWAVKALLLLTCRWRHWGWRNGKLTFTDHLFEATHRVEHLINHKSYNLQNNSVRQEVLFYRCKNRIFLMPQCF